MLARIHGMLSAGALCLGAWSLAAAATVASVEPAARNATADAAPPDAAAASDASILEMLQVMDAHQLIDGLRSQVNAMVTASMQQTLHGKKMTPDVQRVIERMQSRMLAAADQMLSWDVLQPIYLRTYRASFSQEEMNSIIAFYKTPAGQALIKKMPLVMKNVMGEIQTIAAPMQEKIQQIQRETLDELNALPARPQTPKT